MCLKLDRLNKLPLKIQKHYPKLILFFLFPFISGCGDTAVTTSGEIFSGIGYGFVAFLCLSLVIMVIVPLKFIVEWQNHLGFISLILFLIATYGAFLSLNRAFKTESPELLNANWLMEHPSAVLASNELQFRFKNHLCPICGKPAKWALENINPKYDDDGNVINEDDRKFVMAEDVDSEEKNVALACEDHTDFLKLAKSGDIEGALKYFNSHYQGPGETEIGLASRDGPVPFKEEAEKLKGDLQSYVISTTFFILYMALFFLVWFEEKNKIQDISQPNMENSLNKVIGPQFQAMSIISILMLGYALRPHDPYGYYILLRWICCPTLGYLAFAANRKNLKSWAWFLGIGALLYNPIFTPHLGREIWNIVNIVTIGALAVFSYRNKFFRSCK
jgi:hypothetical protein